VIFRCHSSCLGMQLVHYPVAVPCHDAHGSLAIRQLAGGHLWRQCETHMSADIGVASGTNRVEDRWKYP
jgi:hypothetical protein